MHDCATHQENQDWKYQRLREDPDAPAVERLRNQCNDRVQEGDVPRVEERVVEHVHVAEAEHKPMEGIGCYHARLQHVQ